MLHLLPGAQGALRGHRAQQGVSCPAAGEQRVQCFFQPGSTVALTVQIPQQLRAQRCGCIPPGRRIAWNAQRRHVPVHLHEKWSRPAAAAVQQFLSGGVGAGVQAGIILLPREAESQPAFFQPGEWQAHAVVKAAAPGWQFQRDRTLCRRTGCIIRAGRQIKQPAQHSGKAEQQRRIQRQHPPPGHGHAPFGIAWATETQAIQKKRQNLRRSSASLRHFYKSAFAA